MPSDAIGCHRLKSGALRCTPVHSGALGSVAITCGIFARSSYLSRSLTTSFFAVRRERLTICRSEMQSDTRYNQIQSDAIRYNQMQSDANRCNDIQSGKIRCVQRQAEAISVAITCFSASRLLGSVTRSFSSVRSRLWYHLMRPGTDAEHSDGRVQSGATSDATSDAISRAIIRCHIRCGAL